MVNVTQRKEPAGWKSDDNKVVINCYKINMKKLIEWLSQRRTLAIKAKIGMLFCNCDFVYIITQIVFEYR